MAKEHKPVHKDNKHGKEEDNTNNAVTECRPQDHNATDECEMVEHGDDPKESGIRRGVDPVLLRVAHVMNVVEKIPTVLNLDLVVTDDKIPDKANAIEYDIAKVYEVEEIDKERLKERHYVGLRFDVLGANLDTFICRKLDVHPNTVVLKSMDIEL